MKILHLAAYYNTNTLYRNLINNLNSYGVNQKVYVNTYNKNYKYDGLEKDILLYNFSTLEFKDKIFFGNKLKKNIDNINNNNINYNIDIVHAHTWFADGFLAYEMHKKYKTKYIIAIRNTDINIYYKYFKSLRKQAVDVLVNAEKIIFISFAYKEKFKLLFKDSEFISELENRFEVIPNAIDNFWFDNKVIDKSNISDRFDALFVGKLDKNKNIKRLIKVFIKKYKNRGNLHIVGDGEYSAYVSKRANKHSNIKYYGKINDRNRLLEIFRKNDVFIMPSHKETFGNVYIEALTQGLPIIYTKNQGVDGYFDDIKVGVSVDSKDLQDIYNSIEDIIMNYEEYKHNIERKMKEFSVSSIISKYYHIYKEISKYD